MPATVGVGSSGATIIFAAARRSSNVRSLAARASGSRAAGRYSSWKSPTRRSASPAPGTGRASKRGSRCRRFSLSTRSSWAVATARRGPTRIHVRPWYRTGGASDGWTTTKATGASKRMRFSTVMVGGGTMFPSVLMSASCSSSRSLTSSPDGLPSSRAPTKTTPGRRRSGRSLAKAQTASRTLAGASPRRDSLRSTKSDSTSLIRASSSASEYVPVNFPVPVAKPPGRMRLYGSRLLREVILASVGASRWTLAARSLTLRGGKRTGERPLFGEEIIHADGTRKRNPHPDRAGHAHGRCLPVLLDAGAALAGVARAGLSARARQAARRGLRRVS